MHPVFQELTRSCVQNNPSDVQGNLVRLGLLSDVTPALLGDDLVDYIESTCAECEGEGQQYEFLGNVLAITPNPAMPGYDTIMKYENMSESDSMKSPSKPDFSVRMNLNFSFLDIVKFIALLIGFGLALLIFKKIFS